MKIYQVIVNWKDNIYGDISILRHMCACAYIHVETDKMDNTSREEQARAMLTVCFCPDLI